MAVTTSCLPLNRGASSYPKVPVYPSTMPMYKETTHIPRVLNPMDWQVKDMGKPKGTTNHHLNLTLLLLIQTIWKIKNEVEHVKIITHKLYASSYIMIITRQLYSSSYALLYKWYESMTMEELFIVLFIPRCHSSSKETRYPSSSCLAHKSTTKTKREYK